MAVRKTKVSVTLCNTTDHAFERFMPVPVTIVTPRKTQACLSGPPYRASPGDRVNGIIWNTKRHERRPELFYMPVWHVEQCVTMPKGGPCVWYVTMPSRTVCLVRDKP